MSNKMKRLILFLLMMLFWNSICLPFYVYLINVNKTFGIMAISVTLCTTFYMGWDLKNQIKFSREE